MVRKKKPLDPKLILVLIAALVIFYFYSSSTGNFGISSQPQVFVNENDLVYTFLSYTGSSATITAPDGRDMTVTYTKDSLPLYGTTPGPVIVKVSLDGRVLAVRKWSECTWNIDTNFVKVTSSNPNYLLGAAVDGTWTIKSSVNVLGLSTAIRLDIGGKVFSDVNSDNPAIHECAPGGSERDMTAVKNWNWHMQPANSVYLVGLFTSTSSVESHIHAKYFHHVSAIPDVNTGLGGQTPFYSDNFDATLTIPSASDPVSALATNYQYATAPTRWVQYNVYSVYAQHSGKMNGLGVWDTLFGSPLVLKGYVWGNYIAKYNAESPSDAIGGFTVRSLSPLDYIAVQPYRNGDPVLVKVVGGLNAFNDLDVLFFQSNWPEGQYTVEALGNQYKVKVNGETYLIFQDKKSSFLVSEVGLYQHYTVLSDEQKWDNFRISSL